MSIQPAAVGYILTQGRPYVNDRFYFGEHQGSSLLI